MVFNNALRNGDVALRPERLKEFYGALKAWNSYCYTADNLLNLEVQDGELILIANDRILHGSTALPTGVRIQEQVTHWDYKSLLVD